MILKLGGSVITDKERAETLDGDSLDRAADAIADALEADAVDRLVVVHGGGSFGHEHADAHGVTPTEGTRDPEAVGAIHGAMTVLNGFVVERLLERSVPAVPVHPLSVAARDADGTLSLPAGGVERLLAEGFVPVLHGDVVPHEGRGVTIASGDELVAELARRLGTDRVGLCSTVPGVLDDEGAVVDRIDDLAAVEDVLGGSDATDVTGGMAAKVETLLTLESRASIFGLADLEAFLAGGTPGTTVE